MHSPALLLIALAASHAAADQLNLYLGDGCNNSGLGVFSPVELGDCIHFDQARSYILQKNDGDVYNLYSGGGCHQYEGQVTLSGSCSPVGGDITGIMNIGQQDRRMIRGATRQSQPKGMSKRVDGDTYQCPNVPYFFVVTSSSAVQEEIGNEDEQDMRADFMAQFQAAYEGQSGQTEISSYSPYNGENIDDVTITLDMDRGVAQDFQPWEMYDLTTDLLEFRDRQRSPVNFLVALYSGRVDGDNGFLGTFEFRGAA
jgi:hypothetical protein